jgi:hypothetical protein
MAAGIPPENPILMLQAHQIDIAGIERMGGCSIGRYLALGDLETHPRRICVRRLGIVDGCYRQSSGAVLGSDRIAQIGREGCNPALSRKVVPNHRYPEWKRPTRYRLQGGR